MLTSVKVCCVQAEENISFKSKKQQSVSLSIKIDAECFYSINQTKLKYFDLLAFSVKCFASTSLHRNRSCHIGCINELHPLASKSQHFMVIWPPEKFSLRHYFDRVADSLALSCPCTFFCLLLLHEKENFSISMRTKIVKNFSFLARFDNDLAWRRKTRCLGVINRRPFWLETINFSSFLRPCHRFLVCVNTNSLSPYFMFAWWRVALSSPNYNFV